MPIIKLKKNYLHHKDFVSHGTPIKSHDQKTTKEGRKCLSNRFRGGPTGYFSAESASLAAPGTWPRTHTSLCFGTHREATLDLSIRVKVPSITAHFRPCCELQIASFVCGSDRGMVNGHFYVANSISSEVAVTPLCD